MQTTLWRVSSNKISLSVERFPPKRTEAGVACSAVGGSRVPWPPAVSGSALAQCCLKTAQLFFLRVSLGHEREPRASARFTVSNLWALQQSISHRGVLALWHRAGQVLNIPGGHTRMWRSPGRGFCKQMCLETRASLSRGTPLPPSTLPL